MGHLEASVFVVDQFGPNIHKIFMKNLVNAYWSGTTTQRNVEYVFI